MNLPLENADCVGQDELCKVVTNNSEAPKTELVNRKFRLTKSKNRIIRTLQIMNLMIIAVMGYFALLEKIQILLI